MNVFLFGQVKLGFSLQNTEYIYWSQRWNTTIQVRNKKKLNYTTKKKKRKWN